MRELTFLHGLLIVGQQSLIPYCTRVEWIYNFLSVSKGNNVFTIIPWKNCDYFCCVITTPPVSSALRSISCLIRNSVLCEQYYTCASIRMLWYLLPKYRVRVELYFSIVRDVAFIVVSKRVNNTLMSLNTCVSIGPIICVRPQPHDTLKTWK